jgi:hypothetical protein
VIDLSGIRPLLTNLFGSCQEISRVVQLSDGVQVITPNSPSSQYPKGITLSEIKNGHLGTCTTHSGSSCVPTSDDSDPKSFLARTIVQPNLTVENLENPSSSTFFEPTLYALVSRQAEISAKAGDEGLWRGFGCQEANAMNHIHMSVSQIDSESAVGKVTYSCWKEKVEMTIPLVRVDGQWLIDDLKYGSSKIGLRQNLNYIIANPDKPNLWITDTVLR